MVQQRLVGLRMIDRLERFGHTPRLVQHKTKVRQQQHYDKPKLVDHHSSTQLDLQLKHLMTIVHMMRLQECRALFSLIHFHVLLRSVQSMRKLKRPVDEKKL